MLKWAQKKLYEEFESPKYRLKKEKKKEKEQMG